MDDVLGKKLKTYDIILLSETWAEKSDLFEIEGYDFYNYPRNHRHHNARRESGGLGIFVRVSLKHGVDILHNHSDIIAWIKLRKDFFDLEHDLYVANVYFPPERSTHSSEDPFYVLQCDIANLPDECFVLTCGDFNARTQNLHDYSTECIYGSDGGLVNILPSADIDPKSIANDLLIQKLHDRGDMVRSSKDNAPPNQYGRSLVDMCKSAGLLILNGRTGKDKGIGNFTRVDTTGRSIVDYMVVSPQLLELVSDFAIANACPESDHIPLSLYLRCKSEKTYSCKTRYSAWEYDTKYMWSHETLHDLRCILKDDLSNKSRIQ